MLLAPLPRPWLDPKEQPRVVAEKLEANADRDPRTTAALESERLTVLRIWEHEPVAETVDRIAEAVTARR